MLKIPAWIRWLTVEPMLSEIKPTKSKCSLFPSISQVNKQKWGEYLPLHQHIDWVVLGFESGSQARIG